MSVNFSYRRYEKMIKSAYYDQRKKDTPFLREIKVFWHVGESGSGKSYVAKEIADDRGEDFIYMYVDYSNGGLDHYNGEPILFMDEFRGQIPYTVLLNMLQGYKVQAHARYANVVPLWDEVHITSVLPPEEVYRKMVEENKNLDTLEQLKRRITDIIYHYIDEDGKFCTFQLPMQYYSDYGRLKWMAESQGNKQQCFDLGVEVFDGQVQTETDRTIPHEQVRIGGDGIPEPS